MPRNGAGTKVCCDLKSPYGHHYTYILTIGVIWRALVELIALQESGDSDFSSSDEEDIDFLLLELSFKPKKILGPRVNPDDLSEVECEQLFRFVFSSRQPS